MKLSYLQTLNGIILALTLTLVCMVGLSVPTAKAPVSLGDASRREPADPLRSVSVLLIVSVAWEGLSLHDHNLIAIQDFVARHSSIPLTHFFNPAYLSCNDTESEAGQHMLAVLRPIDSVGVKVSATKSLVECAEVVFRSSPTFWGHELSEADCQSDCGHDVPLSVYRVDEIRKIIATGLRLMKEQELPHPSGFMASGWMSTENIHQVFAEQKIQFDYSAVAVPLLAQQLNHYPLLSWLQALWPHVTPYSQPRTMPTPAGEIVQVGNNLATVDYLTANDIEGLFASYIQLAKSAPGTTLVFHIGAHQETAAKYLPRLEDGLARIFALANKEKINILPFAIGHGTPTDINNNSFRQAH